MSELNLALIREQRIKLNLTQQDMAKHLGMSNKADYNRYENGVYSFDAKYVPMLHKVLKIEYSDLFTQKVNKIET